MDLLTGTPRFRGAIPQVIFTLRESWKHKLSPLARSTAHLNGTSVGFGLLPDWVGCYCGPVGPTGVVLTRMTSVGGSPPAAGTMHQVTETGH